MVVSPMEFAKGISACRRGSIPTIGTCISTDHTNRFLSVVVLANPPGHAVEALNITSVNWEERQRECLGSQR